MEARHNAMAPIVDILLAWLLGTLLDSGFLAAMTATKVWQSVRVPECNSCCNNMSLKAAAVATMLMCCIGHLLLIGVLVCSRLMMHTLFA